MRVYGTRFAFPKGKAAKKGGKFNVSLGLNFGFKKI